MKLGKIYLLIIFILCSAIAVLSIFFFKVQQEITSTSMDQREENFAFIVGEEEGEVIRELIITMARTNPAVLAFKKSRLESLGSKLRTKVTTLEFLAFVFSNPELANEMKLLQESSIKYKKFIEGLFPKMLREYEKEGFYLRIQHFAMHLELDYEEFVALLNECFSVAREGDKAAFKPLIDYLIEAKAD